MFEKLPAARMNDREKSSTERLIADAHERRSKRTLHDGLSRFPSYLRLFGIFFGLLISESYSGTAQLLARYCGRFPTLQAHVAFL
jgi:hypothetical protein